MKVYFTFVKIYMYFLKLILSYVGGLLNTSHSASSPKPLHAFPQNVIDRKRVPIQSPFSNVVICSWLIPMERKINITQLIGELFNELKLSLIN